MELVRIWAGEDASERMFEFPSPDVGVRALPIIAANFMKAWFTRFVPEAMVWMVALRRSTQRSSPRLTFRRLSKTTLGR